MGTEHLLLEICFCFFVFSAAQHSLVSVEPGVVVVVVVCFNFLLNLRWIWSEGSKVLFFHLYRLLV